MTLLWTKPNIIYLRRVQSTLSSKHIIFTNIVMSCDSYIATVWYIITSEYVRSKNMYYDFLAFLFQRADKYIQDNVARVRDIELLTGLQFLVSLPRGQAARLRTFLPEEIWKTDLVKAWHEMPCPQHDMCQSEWVLARVVWRWWTLEFVDFKLYAVQLKWIICRDLEFVDCPNNKNHNWNVDQNQLDKNICNAIFLLTVCFLFLWTFKKRWHFIKKNFLQMHVPFNTFANISSLPVFKLVVCQCLSDFVSYFESRLDNCTVM